MVEMSHQPALVVRADAPPTHSSETGIPLLASDLFIDLLPGYLDARRNDVARMRGALDAGAFTEIRFIGHRIRGTGGSYGLPMVTEIGAGLEMAAEKGDASAVVRGIEALVRELARATALIDEAAR